ncbi:ABC transporter substrate-binding protein [Litoreibacter albidus]|uniref:ABC transporter substrate-binding protein n=1 Tax=Litoreibacter albidus TaxID=670155 RepID=UPI003736EDB4
MRVAALSLCAAVWAATAPTWADSPARVVSINVCTDQLAMLVADSGQLVSVSQLASDPRISAMTEQAARYPANSNRAEEVYLMRPDLVLAGSFTARATVDMLRRLDIPVAVFDPAYSLADVRDRLVQMGDVLGREVRAAGLVAEFDATLESLRDAAAATPPRVALYYANGYTSGENTLAGQILDYAGLANVATEQGFAAGGFMSLEVLAMATPETVITGSSYRGPARAEEIKSHPVIGALQRGAPRARLADHDWTCGTPFVLRAIADMTELRRALQEDAQ